MFVNIIINVDTKNFNRDILYAKYRLLLRSNNKQIKNINLTRKVVKNEKIDTHRCKFVLDLSVK